MFLTKKFLLVNFKIYLSVEAARFVYENRYAPYDVCKTPCESMKVYTSLKYKINDINDPSVTIIFPRYITVTIETFVHSFITLGNMKYYSHCPVSKFSDLVAELGGYLGMILGVSLLHLENVFESIDKQSKIDNTLYVKENV